MLRFLDNPFATKPAPSPPQPASTLRGIELAQGALDSFPPERLAEAVTAYRLHLQLLQELRDREAELLEVSGALPDTATLADVERIEARRLALKRYLETLRERQRRQAEVSNALIEKVRGDLVVHAQGGVLRDAHLEIRNANEQVRELESFIGSTELGIQNALGKLRNWLPSEV